MGLPVSRMLKTRPAQFGCVAARFATHTGPTDERRESSPKSDSGIAMRAAKACRLSRQVVKRQADSLVFVGLATCDSAVSSYPVGHVVGMKRPSDFFSQGLQIQLAEA